MGTEGLVRAGVTVYICSRKLQKCKKAANELTAIGPGRCIALSADLSSVEQCRKLAHQLKENHNVTKLHILINNSGATWVEPFKQYSEKGWDKLMNINLKSVFFLTQALFPLLLAAGTKNDPARVINISSINGLRIDPLPYYAYFASKAGVIHLSKKLAAELACHNITVNVICPGLVPTNMTKGLSNPKAFEKILQEIPLKRAAYPEDMAGPCIFLCSRAAA